MNKREVMILICRGLSTSVYKEYITFGHATTYDLQVIESALHRLNNIEIICDEIIMLGIIRDFPNLMSNLKLKIYCEPVTINNNYLIKVYDDEKLLYLFKLEFLFEHKYKDYLTEVIQVDNNYFTVIKREELLVYLLRSRYSYPVESYIVENIIKTLEIIKFSNAVDFSLIKSVINTQDADNISRLSISNISNSIFNQITKADRQLTFDYVVEFVNTFYRQLQEYITNKNNVNNLYFTKPSVPRRQ